LNFAKKLKTVFGCRELETNTESLHTTPFNAYFSKILSMYTWGLEIKTNLFMMKITMNRSVTPTIRPITTPTAETTRIPNTKKTAKIESM
jgi:hypothetical protein